MTSHSLPEHPGILLTIFLLDQEYKQPLTRDEILGLIKEHDPALNGPEVFLHWFALRHLNERRGSFCVSKELAEQLEREGIEPTLSQHNRRCWVVENAHCAL